MIIKNDYHRYDKTYLPAAEVNQEVLDPMIFVKKETILAAWSWYEHYLNIAVKLFTVDYNVPCKSMSVPPLVVNYLRT